MAMYPCEFNGHRYRSAQQTMYPAIVNGTDGTRRKLRLCPEHFEDLLEKLQNHATNAQEDMFEHVANRCFICGLETTDAPSALFVTVYAQGMEREDFWAPLHKDCAPAAREDWRLPA